MTCNFHYLFVWQELVITRTTSTTTMTEGEAAAAATNGQTKAEEGEEQQQQQEELEAKIVKQIEYYFGDYNLPRDKFLQQEVRERDRGNIF